MKITLFTSDNNRHKYLAKLLSTVCDEFYLVQERKTTKPKKIKIGKHLKKYFKNVSKAQNKFFNSNQNFKNKRTLKINYGELNSLSINKFKEFFESDLYIVFGSSYIKGRLLNFLIKKKTINIHAGVSPYYKGTDCNFWALYDNNPHLVGVTIHMLSKGLDSGPILYHAMSKLKKNSYEYTMSTIKSAFVSVVKKIKNKSIYNIKPLKQNQSKQIRYSKKIEFDDIRAKEFISRKIDLNCKKIDKSLLKNPFFLIS
tara:strand:+ start:2129 stop:2896 length:768 start_codon:yes stop_codon:yes gene_type:complete